MLESTDFLCGSGAKSCRLLAPPTLSPPRLLFGNFLLAFGGLGFLFDCNHWFILACHFLGSPPCIANLLRV